MKKDNIIWIISIMLILVFTYTAMSKLIDYETFRGQMLNQPLPMLLNIQLAWAVPTLELLTAGMLTVKKCRKIGLVFSVALMTIFSIYVGLVLSNAFDRIPCSCGGILESLSWERHLVVNILLWSIALAGLILEVKRNGLGHLMISR